MDTKRALALWEVVNEMDDSQEIEIGTKGGSGYFYIGTVGDLKKNINSYNDALQAYADRQEAEARKRFERALQNPPTIEAYMAKLISKYDDGEFVDTSYEGYQKYQEKWFASFTSKKHRLEDKEKNAKNVVTLFRRGVHEVFKSVVDKGALNIIITGDEIGRFWDKSEVGEEKMLFGYNDEES